MLPLEAVTIPSIKNLKLWCKRLKALLKSNKFSLLHFFPKIYCFVINRLNVSHGRITRHTYVDFASCNNPIEKKLKLWCRGLKALLKSNKSCLLGIFPKINCFLINRLNVHMAGLQGVCIIPIDKKFQIIKGLKTLLKSNKLCLLRFFKKLIVFC